MSNFVWFRGKEVSVIGGNVENDIETLYPILFPNNYVQLLYVEFPDDIQLSIVSPDNVETDYKLVKKGTRLQFDKVIFANIKIKSNVAQTGYIYTGGV